MTLPYSLPTFPTLAAYWAPGFNPDNDPPTKVDVPVALYYATHSGYQWPKASGSQLSRICEIRVDPTFWTANIQGTPIVGGIFQLVDQFAGNAWNYVVDYWDYYHWGFANAYPFLIVEQCDGSGNQPDPTR